MTSTGLFGAVFAGGRSQRMGSEKGLLAWPLGDGRPSTLVGRACSALAEICDAVEIAGAAPVAQGLPWATFEDAEPGAGPLSGLIAALRRGQQLGLDSVAVLACDMPFVQADDYRRLLDCLRNGADGAMWLVEGADGVARDQPLCAIYRSDVLEVAEAAFASGARRLVAIGQKVAAGGRQLRLDRVVAHENSTFRLVNVNTPGDYDAAARRLGISQGRPRPQSP